VVRISFREVVRLINWYLPSTTIKYASSKMVRWCNAAKWIIYYPQGSKLFIKSYRSLLYLLWNEEIFRFPILYATRDDWTTVLDNQNSHCRVLFLRINIALFIYSFKREFHTLAHTWRRYRRVGMNYYKLFIWRRPFFNQNISPGHWFHSRSARLA